LSTLIQCGTLLDGLGGVPRHDVQILVVDKTISYIGPIGEDLQADTTIDLSEKTVLPGLIDAHVHFPGTRTWDPLDSLRVPHDLAVIRAAFDARAVLMSGFTSCRCCGSSIGPSLKKAVNEGTLEGPTIVACGRPIAQTGGERGTHYGHPGWLHPMAAITADGPEACRKAVREQLKDGIDFIKVFATGHFGSEHQDPHARQFTPAELDAIVDEAHSAGRKVAAHAHGKAGIDNAVMAGVDTIQHGTYMDMESALRIRDQGVYWIPTLTSILHTLTEGSTKGTAEWVLRKSAQAFPHRRAAFELALEVGIKIAVGTNSLGSPLQPYGASAQELERMVEFGMTPMQAIVAATKTAAEACGLEKERGTLQEGMHADLIAVDGSPLEHIAVLQRVSFVMRNGKIIGGAQRA